MLACLATMPEMVNTQNADSDEIKGFIDSWDPRLIELLGLVTQTSV